MARSGMLQLIQALGEKAGVNIEAGHGGTPVEIRYAIIYAIYQSDRDLHNQSYAIRVLYGESLSSSLTALSPSFEKVPTARIFGEKSDLADKQKSEGREGKVWFDATILYHSGKNREDNVVRTKYLTELNVMVTSLTPTTAQGRLFGAIEVSTVDGKPLGSIGTGFTQADAKKIWDRFHESTRVMIPIVSQGMTENGQVMHGRLSEEFE